MAEHIGKSALMGWTLSRIYQKDENNMVCETRKIEDFPAADVQPVRHGRWKPGDMPTYGGFKCSLCKKNTIVYKPPYCPNCGAKMDAEVRE